VPSADYIAGALTTAAAITFALRALPFAAVHPLRGSRLAGYLGTHMPAGIMVILVVYLLRDVSLTRSPYGLPEGVALAVTIGVHARRGNGVLAILTGTATYALLVNAMPALGR